MYTLVLYSRASNYKSRWRWNSIRKKMKAEQVESHYDIRLNFFFWWMIMDDSKWGLVLSDSSMIQDKDSKVEVRRGKWKKIKLKAPYTCHPAYITYALFYHSWLTFNITGCLQEIGKWIQLPYQAKTILLDVQLCFQRRLLPNCNLFSS